MLYLLQSYFSDDLKVAVIKLRDNGVRREEKQQKNKASLRALTRKEHCMLLQT